MWCQKINKWFKTFHFASSCRCLLPPYVYWVMNHNFFFVIPISAYNLRVSLERKQTQQQPQEDSKKWAQILSIYSSVTAKKIKKNKKSIKKKIRKKEKANKWFSSILQGKWDNLFVYVWVYVVKVCINVCLNVYILT